MSKRLLRFAADPTGAQLLDKISKLTHRVMKLETQMSKMENWKKEPPSYIFRTAEARKRWTDTVRNRLAPAATDGKKV